MMTYNGEVDMILVTNIYSCQKRYRDSQRFTQIDWKLTKENLKTYIKKENNKK